MLVGYESISDKLRDAIFSTDKLFETIEAGGSSEDQGKKLEKFRAELGPKRREVMRMLQKAYRQ